MESFSVRSILDNSSRTLLLGIVASSLGGNQVLYRTLLHEFATFWIECFSSFQHLPLHLPPIQQQIDARTESVDVKLVVLVRQLL